MLYSVFPICGYMDSYLDLFQDIFSKRKSYRQVIKRQEKNDKGGNNVIRAEYDENCTQENIYHSIRLDKHAKHACTTSVTQGTVEKAQ